MTEIDQFSAIHEIQNLKGRYYRSLDTKDWAGFEATLAPDLVADFREAVAERDESLLFEGATAFIESLRGVMGELATSHLGHLPEIDILSPTTAQGIWALEDRVWAPEGAPFRWTHGFGHSHETYTLADGEWRVQTIRLTRTHTEMG